MSTMNVTYDGAQHCTLRQSTKGRSLAIEGCPTAGAKGEELSPFELVGSGLASCMLFAMGMVARRDGLKIDGTTVDIAVSTTKDPVYRIGEIRLTFALPDRFSSADRIKLERATSGCPIKPSFHPDIAITTQFTYPQNVDALEAFSEAT